VPFQLFIDEIENILSKIAAIEKKLVNPNKKDKNSKLKFK
jgi:hypothetical protein